MPNNSKSGQTPTSKTTKPKSAPRGSSRPGGKPNSAKPQPDRLQVETATSKKPKEPGLPWVVEGTVISAPTPQWSGASRVYYSAHVEFGPFGAGQSYLVHFSYAAAELAPQLRVGSRIHVHGVMKRLKMGLRWTNVIMTQRVTLL